MEKQSTKIAIVSLHKYGPAEGSFAIPMPLVFVEDNKLIVKSKFHIYRSLFEDDKGKQSDALIIVPEKNSKE